MRILNFDRHPWFHLLRQVQYSARQATVCLSYVSDTIPVLKLLSEIGPPNILSGFNFPLDDYTELPIAFQRDTLEYIANFFPVHTYHFDMQPDEEPDDDGRLTYYPFETIPIDSSEFEVELDPKPDLSEASFCLTLARALIVKGYYQTFQYIAEFMGWPNELVLLALNKRHWHIVRLKFEQEKLDEALRAFPALAALKTAFQIITRTSNNKWWDEYPESESDIAWEASAIRAAGEEYKAARAMLADVRLLDERLKASHSLQNDLLQVITLCLPQSKSSRTS